MDQKNLGGHTVLYQHPNKPIAVCQLAAGSDVGRFQVIDTTTGRRFGKAKDGAWMGWCMEGQELLLLWDKSESGQYGKYVLERYSWPDERLVAVYEPPFEPYWVSTSPNGRLAALHWIEQGESGFNIVDLPSMQDLEGSGYSTPELIDVPVFSFDGRLIATVVQTEEPYWCSSGGEVSSDRTGTAHVGTLVVGVVGEWDYIEIPLTAGIPPESKIEDLSWPKDQVTNSSFIDERRLKITLPTGEQRIIDVEELRTNPIWTAVKERMKQAVSDERRAEEDRLSAINTYNDQATKMYERLRLGGLNCPHCGRKGYDFDYHAGTPVARAFFACQACGRSFGPDCSTHYERR